MCISLAAAATAASVASAAGGIYAATRKGPDAAKMQARADATAAQSANAKAAARKKALANNSLVASDVMSTGLLNGGRPTLGG